MTTFDVRNYVVEVITEIRFASKDSNSYRADVIKKSNGGTNGVSIRDSDSGSHLEINNIEHADHLIKAIEKAKSLGWLKQSN